MPRSPTIKKIRLLLIEDNRLLREGISVMLRKQKDIQLVTASGGRVNTILMIHKLKPNVILLDLGLRNLNSLRIVEMVKKEFRDARVIVMDLAPVQGDILQFVQAGATGFILKDATLHDFLRTIRAVAKGTKVLPPLLAESLFSQIIDHAVKDGNKTLDDAIRMTRRERQVIGLIGEGMSNKEIGQQLRISALTIKSHIHNIMEKLALHTRLELANYSYTEGTGRPAGIKPSPTTR